jgi:acyl carrier protein
MERNLILSDLQSIITTILDDADTQHINELTNLSDIEGWDSLSKIQIAVGIEKKFKIKFKSLEYNYWVTISDLIDSINDKL